MKENFLKIAQSQVGYTESKNGTTKYGEWYGIPKGDWCAMFVSWCANQAQILGDKIPKYAGCGDGVRWFKKKNQWVSVPKAGDIGFLKPTKAGATSSHTFIVKKVSGNTITTIEGNLCDKVKLTTRKLNATNILGFGSVQWGDENHYPGEYPTLPARGYFYCDYDKDRKRYRHIDKSDEVKKLQQFLNWALDLTGKKALKIDGEYGLNSKNAVVNFQKLVGFTGKQVDGEFGKKSLAKAKEFTK